MHLPSIATTFLALATSIQAVEQGFNYGSTNADGACRKYEDFHSMFTRSKQLGGAPGFTSARLYTMIQCGSDNAPIEAIKAALDTNVNLLLGVWASAGQGMVDNEIIAMKQAAQMWPNMMKQRVKAIAVGSEDLYRNSPEGKENGSDVGANAATVVKYIKQVRAALKGTALEGVRVGHVDTVSGWELAASKKVINNSDWVGFNSFPYWESAGNNGINNAANLFNNGLAKMEAVAAGKEVWITETGWPARGPDSGKAKATPANAKKYWNQVGCKLFGKRNTFWYTLYDANTAQTDLSFAVVNPNQADGQKFNLACPK